MSLYSDIRTAVRNLAIKALEEYFPTVATQNAGILFSHLNGPEPSTPYVVINIINIEQQGHHSTSTLTNTDRELATQVAYEVMIQFGFCGTTAGEMSQHFTQRINNNPLIFEELHRYKLGFMRKSQIRRIPQKRDTQWVEYFNQDVTFSYVGVTEQLVDTVEAVIFEDILNGDTFTIPEETPQILLTETSENLLAEDGQILITEG